MGGTSTAVAVGSEILVTILNLYFLASKQAGLSAEEAKATFESKYADFMAESALPVEDVKE